MNHVRCWIPSQTAQCSPGRGPSRPYAFPRLDFSPIMCCHAVISDHGCYHRRSLTKHTHVVSSIAGRRQGSRALPIHLCSFPCQCELRPTRQQALRERETGGNLGGASRPSSEEPPENDRGSKLDVDKAPPGVTRPDTITVPLPRRWQAIAFIPRPRDHRAS